MGAAEVSRLEDVLRETLADPARDVPAPPDPMPGIRARARRQRRGLALRCLLVLVLVAGVASVPFLTRSPGQVLQPGAAPTAVPVPPGMLSWPTRGALAGDSAFIQETKQVWQAGAPLLHGDPPVNSVRALFAGTIGAGRVAVLEGRSEAGRAWVGVVAEHGPAGSARLALDAVGELPRVLPPLLTIAYSGNLNIPGVGDPAHPGAYLQALAAPGVRRIRHWGAGVEGLDPDRVYTVPRWESSGVEDGLTDAWFSLPVQGAGSRGAVQVEVPGAGPYAAVLPLDNPVPRTVTVIPAPSFFSAGEPLGDRELRQDALLSATSSGATRVQVAGAWSGHLGSGTERLDVVFTGAKGSEVTILADGGDVVRVAAYKQLDRPPHLAAAFVPAAGQVYLVAAGRADVAKIVARDTAGTVLGTSSGRGMVEPYSQQERLTLTAYNAKGKVVGRTRV